MRGPDSADNEEVSSDQFLGISAAKSRLSRQIGIPLTRSGRQRKAGAAMGCMTLVVGVVLLICAGSLLLFFLL